MSFSIGIVGLPNVGKSTLFKAITRQSVDISNYPFCTISPNVGVVRVPDRLLERIAGIVKPEKVTPTVIEFVDIAGLVKGAHQGEGLGNQFLSHIREVAAIAQVVRIFEDSGIIHVSGNLDPRADIEIVNLELMYKDLETADRRSEKTKSEAKSGLKSNILETEILGKIRAVLAGGRPARDLFDGKIERNEPAQSVLNEMALLSVKPVIYVFNVSEKQMADGWQPTPELAEALNGAPHVPISAKIESELAELSENEASEYIKSLGMSESGIDRLVEESYRLLRLITFYTIAGGKEARAWTTEKDAAILEAASRVHRDFAEKFIRAEVIGAEELLAVGSWHRARELGKIQTVGKEYTVQDKDVIEFKI